jgi:hypothetical protein
MLYMLKTELQAPTSPLTATQPCCSPPSSAETVSAMLLSM